MVSSQRSTAASRGQLKASRCKLRRHGPTPAPLIRSSKLRAMDAHLLTLYVLHGDGLRPQDQPHRLIRLDHAYSRLHCGLLPLKMMPTRQSSATIEAVDIQPPA